MTGKTTLLGGLLGFVLLGAGAVLAAEATPSQSEIGQALRPAPKLGPSQGIPTPGSNLPRDAGYTPKASLQTEGPPPAAHRAPATRQAAAPATAAPRPAAAEPPRSIAFSTIQFEFGSDRLRPESLDTLKNLGNALNQELKDQAAFRIEGHTDAVGSRAYNAELSRRRAQAVKDYLVRDMSVAATRLQVVGKGSSEPANPRDPYAAENRRVIVINLGG
jgi:outer membrane protein OmpA-like peptidoglycan-associated protein